MDVTKCCEPLYKLTLSLSDIKVVLWWGTCGICYLNFNSINFIGFLKEGETLDPMCKKTTLLFAGCQMIYVIVCLIPVPLFFYNRTLNEIFIILLILIGIWNGGSYYIQIFSQRYNEKFEKIHTKSEWVQFYTLPNF